MHWYQLFRFLCYILWIVLNVVSFLPLKHLLDVEVNAQVNINLLINRVDLWWSKRFCLSIQVIQYMIYGPDVKPYTIGGNSVPFINSNKNSYKTFQVVTFTFYPYAVHAQPMFWLVFLNLSSHNSISTYSIICFCQVIAAWLHCHRAKYVTMWSCTIEWFVNRVAMQCDWSRDWYVKLIHK